MIKLAGIVLRAVLGLLAFAAGLRAATVGPDVFFDLGHYYSDSPVTNAEVRITPKATQGIGGRIRVLDRNDWSTDANGQFYVSNMVAGRYSVQVIGPFTGTTFEITVPDTNGVLNAWELGPATNTPASVESYMRGAFLRTSSGAGTNLTLRAPIFPDGAETGAEFVSSNNAGLGRWYSPAQINAARPPYYADPGGTNDSTSAINDALANAAGGQVVLPPGTYAGNFVIPDGVELTGSGSSLDNGGTVLIAWDTNRPIITVGEDTKRLQGWGIRNLKIDGQQKTGQGLVLRGGAFRGSVQDCIITGCVTNGIAIEPGTVHPISHINFINVTTEAGWETNREAFSIKQSSVYPTAFVTAINWFGGHMASGKYGYLGLVDSVHVKFFGTYFDQGTNGAIRLTNTVAGQIPIISGSGSTFDTTGSGHIIETYENDENIAKHLYGEHFFDGDAKLLDGTLIEIPAYGYGAYARTQVYPYVYGNLTLRDSTAANRNTRNEDNYWYMDSSNQNLRSKTKNVRLLSDAGSIVLRSLAPSNVVVKVEVPSDLGNPALRIYGVSNSTTVIQSNSFVGVLTSTPADPMHVNGAARALQYKLGASGDTWLDEISSGVLGLHGTTGASEFRVYDYDDGAGNSRYLSMRWTADRYLELGGVVTGTNAEVRIINLKGSQVYLNDGAVRLNANAHLFPGTNLVSDLGLSTYQWRNIYGGSVYAGTTNLLQRIEELSGGGITISDVTNRAATAFAGTLGATAYYSVGPYYFGPTNLVDLIMAGGGSGVSQSQLDGTNTLLLARIAERQWGSAVLTNLAGTGALTNAAAFQPASQVLTNLAGTGALTNATGLQPASGNLTNWSGVATSRYMQTTVTNYAHASDLVLPLSGDVRAAVTNAASGDVRVLVTNIVDGASGRLRITADGSARTVSLYWPAGVTVTPLTTNATLNATNLYIPAGKTGVAGFTCAGTNSVTVITAVSP